MADKLFVVQAATVTPATKDAPAKYVYVSGYTRIATEKELNEAGNAVQSLIRTNNVNAKILVAEVTGVVAPADIKIVPLEG